MKKKKPSRYKITDVEFLKRQEKKQAWRTIKPGDGYLEKNSLDITATDVKRKFTFHNWKVGYLANCIRMARRHSGQETAAGLRGIIEIQNRLIVSTSEIGESFIVSNSTTAGFFEFDNDFTAHMCFQDMLFIALVDGELSECERSELNSYSQAI